MSIQPPLYIQSINPYQGGKPISEVARQIGLATGNIIKLASNENPLGIPLSAQTEIQKILLDGGRYPDGNGVALKAALVDRYQCHFDGITLGNGSNDILELVARTFVAQGQAIMYSQYSFAVYALVTQAIGAKAQRVPASDYGHDLDAMRQAIDQNTRVIFIANPNNPTGTFIDGASLKSFIASVPSSVVVVLDEAYTEYLGDEHRYDAISWVAQFPNLIVTRTFSKAYGLAGLRVGFGLSSPLLASYMNRVRQPFNVSALAQAAACTVLTDFAFLQKSRELNNEGYAQQVLACDELQLDYIPSFGNFILMRVAKDGAGATEIFNDLLNQGIIVRPVGSYGLPAWLRISIGLPAENKRFIAALKAIYAAKPDLWKQAFLQK